MMPRGSAIEERPSPDKCSHKRADPRLFHVDYRGDHANQRSRSKSSIGKGIRIPYRANLASRGYHFAAPEKSWKPS